MLYHLLVPLAQYNIAFNLFRFQTFRAAGAVVTAFLVAFWFGPAIISRLFDFLGWSDDWDRARVRDLPDHMLQGEPSNTDLAPNTKLEE